jgi:YHS domain-containing protein
MKSIVIMLGLLLCGSVVMLGCEAREEVTPAPAVPAAPDESGTETPTTEPAGGATTAPSTQASAALTVTKTSNAFCPIDSDHKVDPKVTLAHDGKTIGFCCEDCIPTFKKEPAKYLASMK